MCGKALSALTCSLRPAILHTGGCTLFFELRSDLCSCHHPQAAIKTLLKRAGVIRASRGTCVIDSDRDLEAWVPLMVTSVLWVPVSSSDSKGLD